MRYRYQHDGWHSYRYKPIELSPQGQEKLRRWRKERDARLRAEFPEYFARLDRRKSA